MKKGILGFGKKKQEVAPAPAKSFRGVSPPVTTIPPASSVGYEMRRPEVLRGPVHVAGETRYPEKTFAYLVEQKRLEREERKAPIKHVHPQPLPGLSTNQTILLGLESKVDKLNSTMSFVSDRIGDVYEDMEKLKTSSTEKDRLLKLMKSDIIKNNAKLLSMETRARDMEAVVYELRGVLNKVKSIENLIVTSKKTEKDLEEMGNRKEHLEEMSIKLDKKFRGLNALRKRVESQEEIMGDLLKSMDTLDTRSTMFVKNDYIEKMKEELTKSIEDAKEQIYRSAGQLEGKVREFESLRKKVEANDATVNDLLKSVNRLDLESKNFMTKNDIIAERDNFNKTIEALKSHAENSVGIVRKRLAEHTVKIKDIDAIRRDLKKNQKDVTDIMKSIGFLIAKTDKLATKDEINKLSERFKKVEVIEKMIKKEIYVVKKRSATKNKLKEQADTLAEMKKWKKKINGEAKTKKVQ